MPQDVPGSSCMFSALRLGVRHFKKLWLLFVRNNLLRRNPGAKDTHCSWVTHCCQAFSFCLCPAQSWFHSEQLLPSVGHCLGREPWLSRSRVHQGSQGFIGTRPPHPFSSSWRSLVSPAAAELRLSPCHLHFLHWSPELFARPRWLFEIHLFSALSVQMPTPNRSLGDLQSWLILTYLCLGGATGHLVLL